MQVVVAGAIGFVGQQVVREALAMGHQVFALIRPERDAIYPVASDRPDQLTTVPWGADPAILRQGFNIDPGAWVVNTAGLHKEQPGMDPHKVHTGVAQTVVELADGIQATRLVHLSPLLREAGDAFIQSKIAMEGAIQRSGVAWSILRSAPAYGPGDDLLDGIGVWMARSPVIPKFLEQVPLDPIWVGDLATALLRAQEGIQEVGGHGVLWGELLQRCAQAAGKRLLGPTLSMETMRRLARSFGNKPLFRGLLPFTEAGFFRHCGGYAVPENIITDLLGHAPRSLDDYLLNEWPYRDQSLGRVSGQ